MLPKLLLTSIITLFFSNCIVIKKTSSPKIIYFDTCLFIDSILRNDNSRYAINNYKYWDSTTSYLDDYCDYTHIPTYKVDSSRSDIKIWLNFLQTRDSLIKKNARVVQTYNLRERYGLDPKINNLNRIIDSINCINELNKLVQRKYYLLVADSIGISIDSLRPQWQPLLYTYCNNRAIALSKKNSIFNCNYIKYYLNIRMFT
jgi:hypothetical protein